VLVRCTSAVNLKVRVGGQSGIPCGATKKAVMGWWRNVLHQFASTLPMYRFSCWCAAAQTKRTNEHCTGNQLGTGSLPIETLAQMRVEGEGGASQPAAATAGHAQQCN
jgi:hypothetical protein